MIWMAPRFSLEEDLKKVKTQKIKEIKMNREDVKKLIYEQQTKLVPSKIQ